jgi:hypothetical protein
VNRSNSKNREFSFSSSLTVAMEIGSVCFSAWRHNNPKIAQHYRSTVTYKVYVPNGRSIAKFREPKKEAPKRHLKLLCSVL